MSSPAERISRYHCLRAEQARTIFSARPVRRTSSSWMAASHGRRSSSFSGMPLCILALLAAERKSSASRKIQPRRPATSVPIVVLPEPVTPMRSRIIAEDSALCFGRGSILAPAQGEQGGLRRDAEADWSADRTKATIHLEDRERPVHGGNAELTAG